MADTLKVLGQAAPAATTETDLYTVPGATTATASTLVVANRSTATTFRLSVSVGGAATANKDYIAYDVPLAANETITFTVGLSLGAADKVRVFAGSADVSFSLFGVEVT